MKIKFYTLLSALILTISCNQKNNNSIGENAEEIVFQEVNRTTSQFEKVGNSYQYFYQGEFENASVNIFDKVMIYMTIEFLLDNNKILTREDYLSNGFYNTGDPVLIKVWKSKETLIIGDKNRNEFHLDGIKSDHIPTHYKDYPIKQVFAVFHFETKDVINQTKETYRNSIDITKEWNTL